MTSITAIYPAEADSTSETTFNPFLSAAGPPQTSLASVSTRTSAVDLPTESESPVYGPEDPRNFGTRFGPLEEGDEGEGDHSSFHSTSTSPVPSSTPTVPSNPLSPRLGAMTPIDTTTPIALLDSDVSTLRPELEADEYLPSSPPLVGLDTPTKERPRHDSTSSESTVGGPTTPGDSPVNGMTPLKPVLPAVERHDSSSSSTTTEKQQPQSFYQQQAQQQARFRTPRPGFGGPPVGAGVSHAFAHGQGAEIEHHHQLGGGGGRWGGWGGGGNSPPQQRRSPDASRQGSASPRGGGAATPSQQLSSLETSLGSNSQGGGGAIEQRQVGTHGAEGGEEPARGRGKKHKRKGRRGRGQQQHQHAHQQ